MNEPRNYVSSTHTHGTAQTHRQGNQTVQTADSGCPLDDANLHVLTVVNTNMTHPRLHNAFQGLSTKNNMQQQQRVIQSLSGPSDHQAHHILFMVGDLKCTNTQFLIARVHSLIKKQEKLESVRSRKRNKKKSSLRLMWHNNLTELGHKYWKQSSSTRTLQEALNRER